MHRITINIDGSRRLALEACGVDVKEGLVSLELSESDDRWPAVQRLAEDWHAGDIPHTEFTRSEIESAKWMRVQPEWHLGYPQPERDNGYLETTYDLSEYCNKCGVGLIQRAPFRMSAEPRWGTRNVLQLNWIFDEYFVNPDILARVFTRHSIASQMVLDKNGVNTLHTVSQLVIPVSDAPLKSNGLAFSVCESCNRRKYEPVTRGSLPPLQKEEEDAAIVKTQEWFGSGYAAHREVLVCAQLHRDLRDGDARGISFAPIGIGWD